MKRVPFSWLQRLDTLGHRLKLPRFLLAPVCDAYEERLCAGSPYTLISGNNWTSSANQNVTFTAQRRRHDA